MDYYNVIPYKNLAIFIFSIGIFSYYGISLINLLVTIIYPIIKIQAYLSETKVINIIERKNKKTPKKIPIEDLDLLLESLFWLKYWCVYSLWFVIEYYIYYIPFINYIKLGIFLFILINHNISNTLQLGIYDYIDNLVFKEYNNIKPILQNTINIDKQKYIDTIISSLSFFLEQKQKYIL